METRRPARAPFRTVLVQNAWTVLPTEDYEHLAAPYPLAWRARMTARRATARVNLGRAEEVVCLTESMGNLVSGMTSRPVTVARPLAPADVLSTSDAIPTGLPHDGSATIILVPGTLTWYKRPQLALQIAHDLGEQWGVRPRVVYAGRDDGTGVWEAVLDEAQRRGLEVSAATLTRGEMLAAVRTCAATIIPSQLESLSLSLSEALILSPRVIASSLSVHREMSSVLGRMPEWVETWLPHDVPSSSVAPLGVEAIRNSWRNVGAALQLPEQPAEGHSE